MTAVHQADVSEIPSLAALWKAMVEHHRYLVDGQWPVLPADEAWARRQKQYSTWLTDGTGFIFTAWAEGVDTPVGYAACRLLPAGPTFDLGELRGAGSNSA